MHEHGSRDWGRAAAGAGGVAAGCGAQLTGIIVALGLAALLVTSIIGVFDPLERSHREYQYWRQERLQDDLYRADLWAGWAWRLAPALGAAVLLCGLSAVTVVMVYRRWATWEMLRAEKLIALRRAEAQRFPPGLRSLSFHDRSQVVAPDPALALPGDERREAPEVPSFAALLAGGRLGRHHPMLLGYDEEGQPVEGSWLDLYSCGIGGLSGSGKSTTAAFLAGQAALYGTRIVLLDPHAASSESLSQRLGPLTRRFLCAPAEHPREMLAALDLVGAELRARLQGKRGDPWLFIADEYSSLQRGELAEPLSRLVEALGQEGRKLQLYAMVCGQVWTASRAGGTEVRDTLASAYLHRLRPAQARYLTGLAARDLPGDLLTLPPGEAYLFSASGELRRVRLPYVEGRDLARVAAMLDDPPASAPSVQASAAPPAEAGGKPGGSLPEAGGQAASSASIRPEAARALALFRAGRDIAQIVKELYGLDAGGGGRRYQEAARAVQRLLREALGWEEAA